MIDPPEGWMYGFPKPAPKPLKTGDELEKWFLKQGYPQKLIDQGMLKYCRFFDAEPYEDTYSDLVKDDDTE
jgi:hypothetical protein